MLLVVGAAAIIMVSAMAFGLVGSGMASDQTSAKADGRQPVPGTPYYIAGNITDELGNPIVGATVVITNLATGQSNTTVSIDGGVYLKDINNELDGGWTPGDTFNLTADNGLLLGWNETIVAGLGAITWIDITLTAVIPEFSTLIVPVMGALAIAVVVGSRRR